MTQESLEARLARVEATQDYTLEKVTKMESQLGDIHKGLFEGRVQRAALALIVGFATFVTGIAASLATILGWWGNGK